jgi:exonuclease I
MSDYPEDPIVAEIRAIRKAHAEKFNNDLHAICEDIRRLQRESGRVYVTLPPRWIKPKQTSDVATEDAIPVPAKGARMPEDPIVAEIRAIRKAHAEKFNNDLHAICEDFRRQERQSGRKYVTLPPRLIQPVPTPDAIASQDATPVPAK